jgi:NADPH-dependent curcumin reductase CurA
VPEVLLIVKFATGTLGSPSTTMYAGFETVAWPRSVQTVRFTVYAPVRS